MQVSLPAGSFSPVPAALPTGRAPADISHTWDGVLHAIDQDGAPYAYDRVQRTWNPVGTGIDAAARVGNLVYHFRGLEYVTSEFGVNQVSAPAPITQGWPGLPRSFWLGVRGAASLGGRLYLFAQGRYVCVDEPGQVSALADLAGWPSAPAWADGVIDGTFSLGGDQVMVFRDDEWITFSLSARAVLTPPAPLAGFGPFRAAGLPAGTLGPGFAGGFSHQDGPPAGGRAMTVYAGITALSYSSPNPPLIGYLPTVYPAWPDAWNPRLAHAFAGRSGALWSATRGGRLVSLEADGYHGHPQQAGQASAGADGSVYFTDPAGTAVYALADPGTPVFTSPQPISQLSHGRAGEAWALGEDGSAVRVTVPGTGAAASAQALFQARAISANADGSVWHVGADGQPARYTDTTGTSELLPGAPAASLVGSNSAGHGYIAAGTAAGSPAILALHEYTSPFLFKTMGMPQTRVYDSKVEYGGGRVFYCTWEPPHQNRVIACDYESGEVVWTQTVASENDFWNAMTYSPALDCLVAVSAENGISAFRSSDGAPVSPASNTFSGHRADSVSVDGTLAVTLSLNRGGGSSDGTCMAWDLQAGQVLWEWAASGAGLPATPLITDQYVFFMTRPPKSSDAGCVINRCARDSRGELTPTRIWSDNGTANNNHWSLLVAPIVSKDFTADEALYFVDGSGSIRAVSLDGRHSFAVSPAELIGPGPVQITSGLTYAEGCIWFGCSIAGKGGALVGLDTRDELSLVPHTPFYPDVAATTVVTSPLFYRNTQGQPLVVFGTQGVAKLWAFNPADGSSGSIDTMGTEITALTASAPAGIVRCGGAPPGGVADSLTAYYGIRLEGIPLISPPQYSLVADSQLMQDPDPQAANADSSGPDNPIAPSVARYQTHLTVVDAGRLPVPNLEVKLYVDQASTGVPLTVQGQPVTVPPSGLIVSTDSGGKITVVSDAGQLTAAALRVWAPFMDNNERMVIHPDHEFHQRVMTAHANAADDDPGRVNLITAHDYDGNPYFSNQEKAQNAPQQTASAVQQIGHALGVGVSTPGSAPPGSLRATAGKYVTYADTGGLSYYPADTIARRPLAPPAAAFALHVARAANGSLVQNVLSLHEAGAVIDGLPGDPWTPPQSSATGPVMVGSWWDDFWNWVSSEVEKVADVIQQVVVAVADTVQVAIQVVDSGIRKVFHFVVKELEDAVKTIGSFFIQLGKLVIHTIEALSLLFDFKEILAAHHLIQALAAKLINGDPADSQNFPGLVGAIRNSAVPAIQGFIARGDQQLGAAIDEIKAHLPGSVSTGSVSQLKGQGNTEHTTYQVPSTAGGPATPTHAVQCSWGSDAMKRNLPGARIGATTGAAADATGNPLNDFLTTFMASINGGHLAADASKLKSEFTQLFTSAHSATDFLATAVDTVLDFIKLVVESILNLAAGICAGALAAIADAIDDIFGLLTQPIDIPFISWLYTRLTRGSLTVLGAALFIVAIPAAVMFRAFTGQNPSQALPDAPSARTPGVGEASANVQEFCIITGVFSGLLGGLISGLTDATGGDDLPAPAAIFVATLGLAGLLTSYPWISSDNPSDPTVGRFALSVIALFQPIIDAFFACGKIKIAAGAKTALDDGLAFLGFWLGLMTAIYGIFDIAWTKPSYTADFGLALAIAAALPLVVGILKMNEFKTSSDGISVLIAGIVEVAETIAVMICQIILLTTDPPTLSRARPAAPRV